MIDYDGDSIANISPKKNTFIPSIGFKYTQQGSVAYRK